MTRADVLELAGIVLSIAALATLGYGFWRIAPVAVWFVAALALGLVGVLCIGLANRGGA